MNGEIKDDDLNVSNPRTAVLFIRSMPVDLKCQFRAWCIRRNITMTQKIISLMKETIKEEK